MQGHRRAAGLMDGTVCLCNGNTPADTGSVCRCPLCPLASIAVRIRGENAGTGRAAAVLASAAPAMAVRVASAAAIAGL